MDKPQHIISTIIMMDIYRCFDYLKWKSIITDDEYWLLREMTDVSDNYVIEDAGGFYEAGFDHTRFIEHKVAFRKFMMEFPVKAEKFIHIRQRSLYI